MNYLKGLLYAQAGISDNDSHLIKTEDEVELDLQTHIPSFSGWKCEFWRIKVNLYDLKDISLGSSVDINSDETIDDSEDVFVNTDDKLVTVNGLNPTEVASLVLNVYTREHASSKKHKTATIFSHGIGSQFVVNRELLKTTFSENGEHTPIAAGVKFAFNRIESLLKICDSSTHVIFYEYPLFGFDETTKTSGPFSEINAVLCLRRIIDLTRHELNVRSKHISLLGYSFGTGPTLRMGRFYALHRIAVLAPYTNLYNTAMQLPSYWSFQRSGALNSVDHIQHTSCPIMIMHGIDDNVIDCNHAKTLFLAIPDKARKKRCHLVYLPTGHYLISDFVNQAEWGLPLKHFLEGDDFAKVEQVYSEVLPERALIICESEQTKYEKMVWMIVAIFAICTVIGMGLTRNRGGKKTDPATSEVQVQTDERQEAP